MAGSTKDAIKTTFINMLNEKPLSQITVKAIVETCGVNRNSFYYHFQDLPALIEELLMDEAERIAGEHPDIQTAEEALHIVIDAALQKRQALLHIYHSVNREIFEQYLWKICDYVVKRYGDTIIEDREISELDRRVICQFYRSACFGLVIEWMNACMKSDIKADADRLCELHRGLAEEMVSRSTGSG